MTQPALKLYGDKELMRALHLLPVRVQKRVARSAALAAMRPVATAGKQIERARKRRTGEAREGERREAKRARKAEDTYRLYETIGVVARGPYAGSGTIVAVAGPRVGEKGNRGKLGHLIELGHKKVLWGRRTGGRVHGFPFMKPAFDMSVEKAQQVLRAKLGAGIEREAAKLGKR